MTRLALLLLLGASTAGAQTLSLQVRDSLTGTPVVGAVVRLLRDTTTVAQALTNSSGRVTLPAAKGGTYGVRVHRIGFRPVQRGGFVLAANETTRRELLIMSERVQLRAAIVRDDRRCDAATREGTATAALWEQVRAALTATALTERDRQVPLLVTEFERRAELGGALGTDSLITARIVRGPAFAALPVDTLIHRGFAFTAGPGDEITFAAPDAAVLVSDAFVRTHCFRAERPRGDSIGLAFEPASGRRLPDVRGTLWVDATTNELRSLAYTYTSLWRELRSAPLLGGRVDFHRLPDGAWVVKHWYVRMPRVEGERVAGYIDQGGRADTLGTPTVFGALTGDAYDSTTARPLPGVGVRIVGNDDSTRTAGDGRYVLRTRGAGESIAVASHAKFAVMPSTSVRTFTAIPGAIVTVRFATASAETLVRLLCGDQVNRARVVGLVQTAGGGEPPLGFEVRTMYSPMIGAGHVDYARTGRGGLFAVCDLPPFTPISVGITLPEFGPSIGLFSIGVHTPAWRLKLAPGETRWLDIVVDDR